ncbi:hypothetical protein KUTeg_003536 [Tegillarca granosa]|uniref:Uncharacterized protein n=1 Tax=Tegillarca granosa TaxID=220873 RepID=A0ABQ9FQA2_TEGGR|nr:hypothetical protein KUTeg_003536 [Tegillarca granosa]
MSDGSDIEIPDEFEDDDKRDISHLQEEDISEQVDQKEVTESVTKDSITEKREQSVSHVIDTEAWYRDKIKEKVTEEKYLSEDTKEISLTKEITTETETIEKQHKKEETVKVTDEIKKEEEQFVETIQTPKIASDMIDKKREVQQEEKVLKTTGIVTTKETGRVEEYKEIPEEKFGVSEDIDHYTEDKEDITSEVDTVYAERKEEILIEEKEQISFTPKQRETAIFDDIKKEEIMETESKVVTDVEKEEIKDDMLVVKETVEHVSDVKDESEDKQEIIDSTEFEFESVKETEIIDFETLSSSKEDQVSQEEVLKTNKPESFETTTKVVTELDTTEKESDLLKEEKKFEDQFVYDESETVLMEKSDKEKSLKFDTEREFREVEICDGPIERFSPEEIQELPVTIAEQEVMYVEELDTAITIPDKESVQEEHVALKQDSPTEIYAATTEESLPVEETETLSQEITEVEPSTKDDYKSETELYTVTKEEDVALEGVKDISPTKEEAHLVEEFEPYTKEEEKPSETELYTVTKEEDVALEGVKDISPTKEEAHFVEEFEPYTKEEEKPSETELYTVTKEEDVALEGVKDISPTKEEAHLVEEFEPYTKEEEKPSETELYTVTKEEDVALEGVKDISPTVEEAHVVEELKPDIKDRRVKELFIVTKEEDMAFEGLKDISPTEEATYPIEEPQEGSSPFETTIEEPSKMGDDILEKTVSSEETYLVQEIEDSVEQETVEETEAISTVVESTDKEQFKPSLTSFDKPVSSEEMFLAGKVEEREVHETVEDTVTVDTFEIETEPAKPEVIFDKKSSEQETYSVEEQSLEEIPVDKTLDDEKVKDISPPLSETVLTEATKVETLSDKELQKEEILESEKGLIEIPVYTSESIQKDTSELVQRDIFETQQTIITQTVSSTKTYYEEKIKHQESEENVDGMEQVIVKESKQTKDIFEQFGKDFKEVPQQPVLIESSDEEEIVIKKDIKEGLQLDIDEREEICEDRLYAEDHKRKHEIDLSPLEARDSSFLEKESDTDKQESEVITGKLSTDRDDLLFSSAHPDERDYSEEKQMKIITDEEQEEFKVETKSLSFDKDKFPDRDIEEPMSAPQFDETIEIKLLESDRMKKEEEIAKTVEKEESSMSDEDLVEKPSRISVEDSNGKDFRETSFIDEKEDSEVFKEKEDSDLSRDIESATTDFQDVKKTETEEIYETKVDVKEITERDVEEGETKPETITEIKMTQIVREGEQDSSSTTISVTKTKYEETCTGAIYQSEYSETDTKDLEKSEIRQDWNEINDYLKSKISKVKLGEDEEDIISISDDASLFGRIESGLLSAADEEMNGKPVDFTAEWERKDSQQSYQSATSQDEDNEDETAKVIEIIEGDENEEEEEEEFDINEDLGICFTAEHKEEYQPDESSEIKSQLLSSLEPESFTQTTTHVMSYEKTEQITYETDGEIKILDEDKYDGRKEIEQLELERKQIEELAVLRQELEKQQFDFEGDQQKYKQETEEFDMGIDELESESEKFEKQQIESELITKKYEQEIEEMDIASKDTEKEQPESMGEKYKQDEFEEQHFKVRNR